MSNINVTNVCFVDSSASKLQEVILIFIFHLHVLVLSQCLPELPSELVFINEFIHPLLVVALFQSLLRKALRFPHLFLAHHVHSRHHRHAHRTILCGGYGLVGGVLVPQVWRARVHCQFVLHLEDVCFTALCYIFADAVEQVHSILVAHHHFGDMHPHWGLR